jgi:hypothetical protein
MSYIPMDAQQEHDEEMLASPPRTAEQRETLRTLAVKAKSRDRLESGGWGGLVDDVAKKHGLAPERAIELIIEFGG